MKIAFLLSVLLPLTQQRATSEDPWSLQSFVGDKLMTFIQEQKDEVERLVADGYSGTRSYIEGQQKKFTDEVYNYIDGFKETGRQMTDPWSFVEDEAKIGNPDEELTVPGIISRHGYICETHTVISQGYVLNIHRIPTAKRGNEVPTKTVLLQHGLFASSADWILNGPDKALAYMLSEAGYDVWMSNIRGNRYSREHTTLKTDSKSYWNFSWHDVAQHDIPAVIDYIMEFKGTGSKISYIGHSMGTTILFAMLTLRPEYNEKLTAGFALAPVVYLSDVKSPLKTLAPVTSSAASMDMLYNSYEFIPKNSMLGKMTSTCSLENTDINVCKNVAFYICGYNEKQFNSSLLPVFLAHLGTGTSWKTVVHFAQEINSGGKFQQFDYGANNVEIYGTESPPEYDLSKITLPISLFWSKNDLLSSEHDVNELFYALESKKEMYLIPDPDFNHLDYLWAVDVRKLLNNKILEYLERAFTHVRSHAPYRPSGYNFNHLRFLSLRM